MLVIFMKLLLRSSAQPKQAYYYPNVSRIRHGEDILMEELKNMGEIGGLCSEMLMVRCSIFGIMGLEFLGYIAV